MSPNIPKAAVPLVVSLVLFVASLPVPRTSAALGFSPLDVSWVYALNVAAARGWAFGTDVLFTYGPLAYLFYPFDFGHHVVTALAFRLLLNALAAVLVLRVLLAPAPSALRAGFVGATVLAGAINVEFQLVAVILLALTVGFGRGHAIALGLAASGAAALGLLIKLTLGVAAMSAVTVFAWLAWRERQIGWRGLTAIVANGPVVAVLLFLIVGGGPRDVGPFFRGSFEIAIGYSAAMMRDGPLAETALAMVAAPLVLAAGFLARAASVRRAAWMAAPPLFFAFKQGLVRPDLDHLVIFLAFMFSVVAVLSAGLILAPDRSRRDEALVMGAFVVAGFTFVGIGLPRAGVEPRMLLSGETGRVLTDPAAFVREPPFRRFGERARAGQRSDLQFFQLPASVRELLTGATVDIVPWDAAYAASTPFEWRPRPVFQSYSAYTPYLDELNASHFRDDRAPRFVLYEPKALDKSHPFLHEPRTWGEILCRYDLRLRAEHLFVLERAPRGRCRETLLVERTLPRDIEIRLPPTGDGIVVGLTIRPSFLGRLVGFVFRMPILHLVVTYQNGMSGLYRLNPTTADGGLALAHLPQDPDGIEQVLRGGGKDRIASIRVQTDGDWAYGPTMQVRVVRRDRDRS